MPVNLMDAVSSLVTPDLVQKAAGASGESPEGVRSALLGAVPTLFAGLAHGASTPSGASQLFGLIGRVAAKPKEVGGASLVTNIFGAHAEGVTDALAGASGIHRSSASGILALVAPVALAALGREVTSRGLSAGGLTDLLFSHKKAILDNPHLPKGLSGAMGLDNLSDLGGSAAGVHGPTVSAVDTERVKAERPVAVQEGVRAPAKHSSRWPIILPALLLGVLAIWGLSNMFKGRPHMGENTENPTMRQPGVEERQSPIAAPPTTEAPREPAPATNAPEMNTPVRPAAALSDLGYHFEFGSTALTPDSNESVDGLLVYLQENPTARIHIEGFADTTGNAGANGGLSDARAKALKSVLVSRGVDSSRIETSGMGSDKPVAPNDNDQDRAQNRRAEVTLIH